MNIIYIYQIHCSAKLLVIDEAHKFMNGADGRDGLSDAIVNVARLMRHDGILKKKTTYTKKKLLEALTY